MAPANLNIITRAAMDDDTIYGRFLTLQRDFHQIMAGGTNGNGHGKSGYGEPFPSKFVSQRPRQEPGPQATPPEPQGPALTIDGQEYVGADS